MNKPSISKSGVVSLIVVAVVLIWQFGNGPEGDVDMAYANQTSEINIKASGKVQRILSDDLEGSQHQRFVVEMPSGLTLLVAHNIDLASRVPNLVVGAPISIKGEYEWNEQGGLVHWTHLDPNGAHEGGWIQFRGKKYE